MSSIKTNLIYNIIYQMLAIVLPLITTPYVSRVLGADGVGIYSYTYTVANYFMLVAMLGVKNHGNRSIAAVREDPRKLSRTFWEIYGLQAICSAIALVAYIAYALLAEPEHRLIFLIQGIYVLTGMLDISWLFFGLEKFKLTVGRNIAMKLLTLVCIFLFVRSKDDLWVYTLILVLGTFFSQSYLWLYVKKEVRWHRPSLSRLLCHLKPELILFIPVIAVSLYKMMDKVMLRLMSDYAQVGFYESSEKILNIPAGLITALGTVMLPRMANLAAKGMTKLSRQYIRDSMVFAMFLSCGMAFGIAGIADVLVHMFLGEEFLPCMGLLKVLAPTVMMISWGNVLRTQFLIPQHRDRSYIFSVSLGAVVNLIANALLIPHLSAMGAAIGTLLAELAVCVSQTVLVRRDLPVDRYLRVCLPMLIPGILMYVLLELICPLFPSPTVATVLGVVIGGTVYVLLCGIYLSLCMPALLSRYLAKIIRRK